MGEAYAIDLLDYLSRCPLPASAIASSHGVISFDHDDFADADFDVRPGRYFDRRT